MKEPRFPTLDEWLELHRDDPDPDPAGGPYIITADELRAAGAFDVPAGWRKSLGGEERRYTLPGFEDDDERDELQPAK